MIVYPAIDIYEGRAVRMTRGDFATVEQVAPSPLEAAKKLVAEGAEWLHVIDLDGSRTGTPANLDHIRAIANRFTVKIQAGGGIRDFDTAEAFAEAGASRIVVGTAAIDDPELIGRLVDRHADGLAVSVDARNGMVTTDGWTETTNVASCTAQGGYQSGSTGRPGTSSATAEHVAEVGFHDRRRFVDLIGETREVLQYADRPFGLPHAVGG